MSELVWVVQQKPTFFFCEHSWHRVYDSRNCTAQKHSEIGLEMNLFSSKADEVTLIFWVCCRKEATRILAFPTCVRDPPRKLLRL